MSKPCTKNSSAVWVGEHAWTLRFERVYEYYKEEPRSSVQSSIHRSLDEGKEKHVPLALWQTYIPMEYPHFSMRHTSSKGPLSIVMLVYQSVYIFVGRHTVFQPHHFFKVNSTSGSVRLGHKPPIMNHACRG